MARKQGHAESPAKPLVLSTEVAGATRLMAVCPVARAAGLTPGMSVSDARALIPDLDVRSAMPRVAARALARLADWALRFTPWVAVDGHDGVWLDITGCAHLFGGETALLARLKDGIARRGIQVRAALADTAGAAWAVARFGQGGIVAPGAVRPVLAPLSVAGLRLDAATVAALERVGLYHIGDLIGTPRAPVARRFGAVVIERVDQALGRVGEPLSPRRPVTAYNARRAFVEPIVETLSIAQVLRDLLDDLCCQLDRAARGARHLELSLFRLDGRRLSIAVGTSRPARDGAHLARLFADHFDGLDVGEGIEVMMLAATATDAVSPAQSDLAGAGRGDGGGGDLAVLVDRLANRLGPDNIARFVPRESHVPERAVATVPPLANDPATEPVPDWPHRPPRPVRLLNPPVPVEAMAMVPDNPPLLFRWRGRVHRVVRAAGPERISGEWWHEDAPARDYYRVEDDTGARFWLFREGLYRDAPDLPPRWFLHGLFA